MNIISSNGVILCRKKLNLNFDRRNLSELYLEDAALIVVVGGRFSEVELPLSSVFLLSHVFSAALPTVESFPANRDDWGTCGGELMESALMSRMLLTCMSMKSLKTLIPLLQFTPPVSMLLTALMDSVSPPDSPSNSYQF